MENDWKYTVCANVYDRLKKFRIPKEYYNTQRIREKVVRESPRLHPSPLRVSKLKKVVVKFGCSSFSIDLCPVIEKRKKQQNIIKEELDFASSKFKFPFKGLSIRERERRARSISYTVIGACINWKELQKEGLSYLNNNRDLAIDILEVIDAIKNIKG